MSIIKCPECGQTYKMGRYGGEEINWRVLAKEPGKVLLISEKALDAKAFNESWDGITWAECTLRKWLNTNFMAEAFSREERDRIMNTKVHAEMNPEYSDYYDEDSEEKPADPGEDTTDRVFLLNIQEAEKYFKNNDARKAFPTEYAIENEASVSSTKTCWWWLRSPGCDCDRAAIVIADGSINHAGDNADYGCNCVRPALWINLES